MIYFEALIFVIASFAGCTAAFYLWDRRIANLLERLEKAERNDLRDPRGRFISRKGKRVK